MNDFSFDEWASLYKSNPIEFERKRKELIEAEIRKAPAEHRAKLRTLQFECDSIREAVDPSEASSIMLKMAGKKLNELVAPLTQLREICEDLKNEK